MKLGTYICDGDRCHAIKGDVNRWWLLTPRLGKLVLEPWSDLEASMPGTKHFCGRSCFLKAIERWSETAISTEELERMIQ